MSWNYRVMLQSAKGEKTYGIHEVYYSDRGKVQGWTTDIMPPCGDTLAELRRDLAFMSKAFKGPVLDYKTGKPVKEVRK